MIVKSVNKRVLVSSENYIVNKKVKGKFKNNRKVKFINKIIKHSNYIQGSLDIMPSKFLVKMTNNDTGIIYY